MKQHKKLTELKKSQFPWMYNCSKCVPQEALRDLNRAFQKFYRGMKTGRKIGFPKFKKKGVKDSFRLNGTIKFKGRSIQLPRIGRIRIKEKRVNYVKGRILSATVKRRANRWFVSITVEVDIPDPIPLQKKSVGVDLGIKTLATLSDGTSFSNPRVLESRIRKLKKLSRDFSRKKKGSKTRKKVKLKLA